MSEKILILLTLLAAGCVSEMPVVRQTTPEHQITFVDIYEAKLKRDAEYAEKFLAEHPDLPAKTVETIRKKSVAMGMTPEEVHAARGSPTSVNTDTSAIAGQFDQWVYRDEVSEQLGISGQTIYIYFTNGKVTSWQTQN